MRIAWYFILVLIVISPVAAWTRTLTFESGTAGSQAQGTSDSFTYAGTDVLFDSTYTHSGSKSAKIHWTTGIGDNWPVAVGMTDFDQQGMSYVQQGQEIWYRAYWYNPSDFDFCGGDGIKQMRLAPQEQSLGGSGGQHTISVSGNTFVWGCETPDYACIHWDIWSDCDGSGPWVPGTSRPIPLGRWYAYEYYIKAVAGDQGIVRVWEDGQLIIERKGNIINPQDYLVRAQIAGVWNNGPCKDQNQYVDDIVITTDTPSGRDAAGNPMIGLTGGSSTSPVCGQNGCESGESCSSCPQDCGTCPCNPNWVCSDWSSCTNSQQTRTCTDSNSCGTTAGRPATTQSCATSTASECANWQSAHPDWIFCDDFEAKAPAVASGSYFEIDDNNGDFVWQDGTGVSGSHAMRALWQQGEVGAGGLKLGFGRNPSPYMNKGIRTNVDFRDIYYRMYLKNDPNWQGDPAKLSRATVIAKSDWGQAMIGHLWSDGSNHLLLDPASCVSGSTVQCSGYNDFNNLKWLGYKAGPTALFDGNHDDWMCIEHHVKLNDLGQSNGVQEFWIDGNLEAQRTGLNFVGSYTDYGINAIFLENYWNDGSVKQQERWFDNFVVSTERIGCLGAVQPPPKCTAADTDSSGIISMTELSAFISRWKSGQENLASLMEVINKWKNGC